MVYLLIGLLIAAISVIPFLLARIFAGAVGFGIVYALAVWMIGYSNASGFAGPMFGSALFLTFAFSAASAFSAHAIVVGQRKDVSLGMLAIQPVIVLFILAGIAVYGSGMLNANQYRALVGNMEKRVWTQDIQPKDPQHFRAVTTDNAVYLARKAVGELGTIGSQFQTNEDAVTLQVIRDELWYVIPLDFAGWRAWNNTGTAIGYIMVHAEDPNRQPIVRQLPKEKQFAYTPGAWFGNDLIRHIRLSGHLRQDLHGTHLEIDDDGNPWWITSVTEPTIGQFGDKVLGVVITDPVTGDSQFAKLGEIPGWIDRVMPRSLTKSYLANWGEYVHGWANSWWGKEDLTEPEEPSLIFSSEREPVFVSGITSQNKKDDSLVGVVYTSTRTGKSILYEVKGGATDQAVLTAVAKFQDVQFKHLQPADPQLYNLYGTMASVMPLVNENHAFSGVAIVSIGDVQQVAVGRSLREALRQYQRLLSQPGGFASIEKSKSLTVAEGLIERKAQDLTQNGSVYYIVLRGGKQAFVGGTEKFPTLPLVQIGDRVRVEYFASGESIVPMREFANLTLVLDKSLAEETAEKRSSEAGAANDAKPVRRDISERLKDATPEDLQRIEKALQK